MAVPVNFLRNKNPNFNLRGALKVNAIFVTDNAAGTEPFQGWLADNNVVTSFNDALIQNKIGVVDTDGFNIVQSNRFAYSTMSEGQKIVRQNFIRVTFTSPIDITNGTANSGDILEFVSNDLPFGTLDPPSNGKQYRLHSIIREKEIAIDGVQSVTNNGNGTWTVILDTDFREDLQEYSPATSTGNNILEGDSVVIFGNALANGAATSYNGTYILDAATSTSITYTTTSNPNGASTFLYPGRFYKLSNEAIFVETIRAVATGVSYNSGTSTVDLNVVGVTLRGTIRVGQLVTGIGVPAGASVVGYNGVTKILTISTNFTQNVGGGTLTLELLDSQTDLPVERGAVAAPGSPAMFINAGPVTDSITVKTPINYYVYGDVRLKYFWSSFTDNGTFSGWTQNVAPDTYQTLYNGGTLSSGTTLQLIGSNPVFSSEDTFNNIIKTLGINRGGGIGGDYKPVGRSALLYISATDSQGLTGGGGGRNRGTSTPAYPVRAAVDAVNDYGGYWVGVIGGSFTGGCQNEIQTFRSDTDDGILGDPRGFIPIKGEVTSVRVGVPIEEAFFVSNATTINGVSVPGNSVVGVTYFNHAFGNPEDQLRIRVKNNTNSSPSINGLRDIVVIDDKQFYFRFPDDIGSLSNITNYDDCGYALNITALLTVPKGFYRKSTFEYIDPVSLSDSRNIVSSGDGFTLSEQPGIGRDRKDILVTIGVTEGTGTLQYFSMYPLGDFFASLPETGVNGIPYFAYPIDGVSDIKFRVKTYNVGSTEYLEIRDAEETPNDLLDAGTTEVTPKTEFVIVTYPIEYVAEVVQTNNSTEIVVDNLELFTGEGYQEARGFVRITDPGSTYSNGTTGTFAADNVTTTATTGTGTGLELTIQFIAGSVEDITITDRGTGYAPGDTGVINAPPGGSVDTPFKATYVVRSIDDSDFAGQEWTLEIFDTNSQGPPVDFIGQGDNWVNPGILSSKTQVEVDSIVQNGSQYTLTLNKPILSSINDTLVAFCYPKDNRRLSVYVKASNNFKDINAEAAINAGLVPSTSDSSITFSGYGYSKGDILTPSDVVYPPASVINAVWTRDTEISQDGFLWNGESVGTGGPYQIFNVPGNLGGTGAGFEVTPTVIGLYNVELIDQGSNYQISEILTIPGYELGGATIPTFARLTSKVTAADLTNSGSGYTPSTTLTNVSTTPDVFNNNGDGTLTFNFTTNSSGQIIGPLVVNNGGNKYKIGDTGTIGTGTATYEITSVQESGNKGSGYGVSVTYTNQPTTVISGSGDGNLTFNFKSAVDGTIDVTSLDIQTPGTGYQIGDIGFITGGTTNAVYQIVNTLNDVTIQVTNIIDNSNVVVTTQDPHGFIPPLGRTSVDILVQDIISTSGEGNFNGRKVADIIDSVTLRYDQSNFPGIYTSGGTIFNVSPDVVNDTFASFRNELFLNVNVTPNDPAYPKIVFIESVTYASPIVTVTTSVPHKFTTGERVQVSGMKFTRLVGEELNAGNVPITVTSPTTFTYSKAVSGNLGTHIPGSGEVTNPYVKVLGGVFTKDFYRIVFVNTSNTTINLVDENLDPIIGEVIEPDKTRDFLVRDINFRQISNDGDFVTDGPKHDFYITANNEITIVSRGIDDVNKVNFLFIDFIQESLEFEVTTFEDHGLWEGNYFELAFDNNNVVSGAAMTAGRIAEYEPGTNQFDIVSKRIDNKTFRYKVYEAGRDDSTYLAAPGGNPRSTSDVTSLGAATPVGNTVPSLGSCIKTVGVGTGDFDTFLGLSGGVSQDLVKFTGLKGFPGVQPTEEYYIVNLDENAVGGDTTLVRLQISKTRSGTPQTFSLQITGATYNRETEEARVDVNGLTPHGLVAGDVVNINGVSSADFNGTKTISFVVSPTSFTYPAPAVSGIADVTNQSFTKNIISGTTVWNQFTKALNWTSGNNFVTINTGGSPNNRARFSGDIAEGMVLSGNAGIPAGTYVTDASQLPIIFLSNNVTTTASNATVTFTAGATNTGNFGAIALNSTGTFPGITNLAIGQKVSGTGIGTNAKIIKIYSYPFPASGITYFYCVVDKSHTATLSSANTFTFSDNQSGGKSVRVRNVVGIPQVGAEIESIGGSGNIFLSGTLITNVYTYTIGGTSGYVLSLDTDLINNFIDQTIKIYPSSSPSVTSATISPITKSFTPDGTTIATTEAQKDYIYLPEQNIAGQLQLISDTTGWDHVKLAKETGGALFFQLGFPLLCNGVFGQNTITIVSGDTAALSALVGDLGTDTVGVYGEGISPGATIASIGGNTITLSAGFTNTKTFTNQYVGFARPNSVSIFPKYTQEFGRILGKTFAEWLFKIA